MTWNDLIMTADFLLLCAIAYGVYRVKKAIEDMYSGLGQLLGQHREITEKILFQLGSGGTGPVSLPLQFPLHVVVRTIEEDLRHFKSQWFDIHLHDLTRAETEKREQRTRFRKLVVRI